MGHALNGSIQDALIRYHRMRGQADEVDPRHRPRGHRHADAGRAAAAPRGHRARGARPRGVRRARVALARGVRRARSSSSSSASGASCDYDDERFTLDESYVRAVLKVFVDLYDKGLIYRDNYMVNWDPGSRSAISDLEVEEREVTDTLYYVDYPLASGRRLGHGRHGAARRRCSPTPRSRCTPTTTRYTRLVGETAILPLVGRRLRIIADPYVKPEFGTGALKITPGHDPNDFEIGRAHGLEELVVIGEDGRMTEAAGERFAGMTALEAREAVVAALREEGAIARTEPYTHAVPHSHRSGERIEPLISLQWFMAHGRAGAAGDRGGRTTGACASTPRASASATWTGWRTSGPGASRASCGGATRSPSGTAASETYVGIDAARGRRLGARPRRARHVVLVRPVAVRDARLAGGHARAARVLPDRRALDGARHPLPLGRAHGDDRARVRRRRPVRRRLRPLDDPGAGRAAHVASRSARGSTRST